MIVTLPWPDRRLSPNARQHWAATAKAKARYRAACRIATLELRTREIPPGALVLSLQFCPPNRRSYDRDNLAARMKAGIDGMCDALGIDDKRFAELRVRMGDAVKGGAVYVLIEQQAKAVTP